MKHNKDHKQAPVERSGMEPELSPGVSGMEPTLGGALRQHSKVVAHLNADMLDARLAREKERLRVIQRLRARVFNEALAISLDDWNRQQQADESLSEAGVYRWRSSRIDTDIDSAQQLEGYQRPVYDSISDEVALHAIALELDETRDALLEAQASGNQAWIKRLQAAIALIESYMDYWQGLV